VSKLRKKLKGRPTFDDRGNAIWKFSGEEKGEIETESVQALAEGLSLEGPSQKEDPDPYNQALAQDKEKTKGRSLDDMRRLNEEMKREHEEHVRKLRSGTLKPHARSAGPVRGVRLRLRFDDRELLVDEHRSSILIGRGDDNDVVVESARASRLHASIELSGNKFILTDVSANGSFIQPADGELVRIRRDRSELNGRGMIGFGHRPKRGAAHTIQFACEKV
jgi:FHA domain